MTKKQKIIAGSIAAVSVIAAIAYIQVMKALKYVLTYKTFKVNGISKKAIDLDVFFTLKNPSSLTYRITQINYDVYVNGLLITKVKNDNDQKVMPRTTSDITANVQIPVEEISKKLKKNWAALILFPEKLNIKLVLNLKVRYGILGFTIPYTETMNYKQLLKQLK